MNALTLAPSRLPMNKAIASEYGIEPSQWRVLVEQVFPAAKSVEAVLMALAYCRARNLDIFKKPVHIVPMWSSEKRGYVETVWPGIAEIRTTAARTGAYAGADEVIFGPDQTRTFKTSNKEKDGSWTHGEVTVTFPAWAKMTVYRSVKGHRAPFTAVVYWEEAYASAGKSDAPNAMWQKRPRGQIAKCVEAAAIRMAFPEEVGSEYTADEMSGQIIDHHPVETAQLTPPPPPPPPSPTQAKEETVETFDEPEYDESTGEIIDEPAAPPPPPPSQPKQMAPAAIDRLLAKAKDDGRSCLIDELENFEDHYGQYLDQLPDKAREQLQAILDETKARLLKGSNLIMAG